MIAAPSIALPACGLVKVFRRMYEAPRTAATCDVRLVIEDDSLPFDVTKPRPIKSTIWAHRIVLACGSEFFRTFFRSAAASPTSWDQTDDGVSTMRFPASSFTQASLEVVLRYIYYNCTTGIDFVTALYCMNTHVTNYFGLREYSGGASSTSSVAPPSFVSDLEKSCIAVLHTSLSSSISSSGALTPLAGDCLALIQSAYLYGDHSLFSKAAVFLDFGHLDVLMSAATRRRQQEEQTAKANRLRKLQARNERNAARDRRRMVAPSSPMERKVDDSDESELSDDESDEEEESALKHVGDADSQFRFIAAVIAEKARTLAQTKTRAQ